MTVRFKSMLAAGAVALAACSPGTVQGKPIKAPARAAAEARHPVSGLKVVPLVIGGHRFRVEVAATPAEQERGLMFRKEMGPDEGMIFPMDPPRQAYFWMRNTVMPLDIIFIGADGKVLNVVNARPFDETPLPSAGKAALVLEINVGRAARLGIGPGTGVKW